MALTNPIAIFDENNNISRDKLAEAWDKAVDFAKNDCKKEIE